MRKSDFFDSTDWVERRKEVISVISFQVFSFCYIKCHFIVISPKSFSSIETLLRLEFHLRCDLLQFKDDKMSLAHSIVNPMNYNWGRFLASRDMNNLNWLVKTVKKFLVKLEHPLLAKKHRLFYFSAMPWEFFNS